MPDIDTFIAMARDHVKSDGDDDNLLTQYANSAVNIASGYCRRNLYWDQSTLDADKATFTSRLTDAENALQTAKDTYLPQPVDPYDQYYSDCKPQTAQDRINIGLFNAAWNSYVATINSLQRINDGIVIDDAIVSALLLIVGHLYRNRQEVISQVGAVGIQLPMGAQRILELKMAV